MLESLSFLDVGSAASDQDRLRRVEAKLDLILDQLGIAYMDPATPESMSEAVKRLADDRKKVAAIKLHRRQTGAGLKQAKEALEAYMASRR